MPGELTSQLTNSIVDIHFAFCSQCIFCPPLHCLTLFAGGRRRLCFSAWKGGITGECRGWQGLSLSLIVDNARCTEEGGGCGEEEDKWNNSAPRVGRSTTSWLGSGLSTGCLLVVKEL